MMENRRQRGLPAGTGGETDDRARSSGVPFKLNRGQQGVTEAAAFP